MKPSAYLTLKKAIRVYGKDSQLKMLLEEMSELQKEICKNWRGRDNTNEIADEIADVEIMLAQVKIIFGIEAEVANHTKMKIDRLAYRITSAKE